MGVGGWGGAGRIDSSVTRWAGSWCFALLRSTELRLRLRVSAAVYCVLCAWNLDRSLFAVIDQGQRRRRTTDHVPRTWGTWGMCNV